MIFQRKFVWKSIEYRVRVHFDRDGSGVDDPGGDDDDVKVAANAKDDDAQGLGPSTLTWSQPPAFVETHNFDAQLYVTTRKRKAGATVVTKDSRNDDFDKEENEKNKVGRMFGVILPRPHPSFNEMADSVSSETQELACVFCESNGVASRVKHSILQDDAVARNSGGYLHVEIVEIKPSHAGHDLGLRFFQDVLDLVQDHWTLCVIKAVPITSESWCHWKDNCRPKSTKKDDESSLRSLKAQDLSVKRHFARMGFSQAGKSRATVDAWFLTKNEYIRRGTENKKSRGSKSDHDPTTQGWLSKSAAQSLEIHTFEDQPKPQGLDEELNRLLQSLTENHGGALMDGCFTVAHRMIGFQDSATAPAVATPPPPDIDKVLLEVQSLVRRGASVEKSRAMFVAAALSLSDEAKIRRVFQTLIRLGGDLRKVDVDGNTPLHIAAGESRCHTIQCLLQHSDGRDMLTTRNLNGATPLDVIEQARRGLAGFCAAFSLSVMAPREIDVVPRFECVKLLLPPSQRAQMIADDWLSPRMHRAFQHTAEYVTDIMNDDCNPLPRQEYIPPEVLKKVTSPNSFRKGWGCIWDGILHVLKQRKAPTVDRVTLISYSYGSGGYLQQGGQIEYAIDALISITRNVVTDGDDGWEFFEEDFTGLAKIPACDTDFDLAWFMCITRGGGNLSSRGPYLESQLYGDGSDEEENYDDDGDEEGDY